MKTFLAGYWHRVQGDLRTVYEDIEARSLSAARTAAKDIARDRGWRLVDVSEKTPKLVAELAFDQAIASHQIIHFEAVKRGDKVWWQNIPTRDRLRRQLTGVHP